MSDDDDWGVPPVSHAWVLSESSDSRPRKESERRNEAEGECVLVKNPCEAAVVDSGSRNTSASEMGEMSPDPGRRLMKLILDSSSRSDNAAYVRHCLDGSDLAYHSSTSLETSPRKAAQLFRSHSHRLLYARVLSERPTVDFFIGCEKAARSVSSTRPSSGGAFAEQKDVAPHHHRALAFSDSIRRSALMMQDPSPVPRAPRTILAR